jgi:ASCH domain
MTIQNRSISGSNPNSSVVPWTPSLAALPAFSVRQPWAWLIVSGLKDIENRPRRTHHRGPLLIHAGLSLDSYTEENVEWLKKKYGVQIPFELDTGGIVGVVDVIDCVESHGSRWFNEGNFGWELANPRRLEFRECRGSLGFFRPKIGKMTMSG